MEEHINIYAMMLKYMHHISVFIDPLNLCTYLLSGGSKIFVLTVKGMEVKNIFLI